MKCHICKRELDQPGVPESLNCGGDCEACMAFVGDDPDCIKSIQDRGEYDYLRLKELYFPEGTYWHKPYSGRKPVNGFLVMYSTPEHKSCNDCEHFRVGDMPNRLCLKYPFHMWNVAADTEIAEFPFTASDNAETRIEHPGQTIADTCEGFKLDAAFTKGEPAKYVLDF